MCNLSNQVLVYSPYHLASSSLMSGDEDDTTAGLGFGAGFFLNRETIFCAPAVGAVVAYREEPAKLSWVPRIFDGASAAIATDPQFRGRLQQEGMADGRLWRET